MKPSEKYLKCEKSGTSLGCGTTAAAPTTAAPGFYKSVPRFDAHVDIDHLEQLCNDAEPADVAMKTEQPAEPTPVTGEPMEVEKSTGRFFYVAKGSYCI